MASLIGIAAILITIPLATTPETEKYGYYLATTGATTLQGNRPQKPELKITVRPKFTSLIKNALKFQRVAATSKVFTTTFLTSECQESKYGSGRLG